jgi:hypothetical protein
MLDTNTLDYIYTNKIRLISKLKKFSTKNIHLYITQIQQDEINKISDVYKKNFINKIISIIGIKRIPTSCTVIGTDKPSKHGFISSMIETCELIDDADLNILEKLQKPTLSNPMSNTADLSILYTAVKKKMDYLITDNTSDFQPMLKEMARFIPNSLKLKKSSFRLFLVFTYYDSILVYLF